MLVNGSPHNPFEGARVVFFLSFGGRLFNRSDDVSLYGMIVALVWADVETEA